MAQGATESVFLNIPYDQEFEELYLAYITGLTMLGLVVRIAFAVPHDAGRLDTIIRLVRTSPYSIHDLSRVSSESGVPRFNMPLELGLALYRSRTTRHKHRVYIFEQESYRIQRSTSDLNGIDPSIHDGTPTLIMAELRNIFLREGETSTVPVMMQALVRLRQALPTIKETAGTNSLYQAAVFHDMLLFLNFYKNQVESGS